MIKMPCSLIISIWVWMLCWCSKQANTSPISHTPPSKYNSNVQRALALLFCFQLVFIDNKGLGRTIVSFKPFFLCVMHMYMQWVSLFSVHAFVHLNIYYLKDHEFMFSSEYINVTDPVEYLVRQGIAIGWEMCKAFNYYECMESMMEVIWWLFIERFLQLIDWLPWYKKLW